MNIEEILNAFKIDCKTAACCSRTEYVCYNTTPEAVDAVLKEIGAYGELRSFWSSDSIWDRNRCVYINRMYTNGKSWD